MALGKEYLLVYRSSPWRATLHFLNLVHGHDWRKYSILTVIWKHLTSHASIFQVKISNQRSTFAENHLYLQLIFSQLSVAKKGIWHSFPCSRFFLQPRWKPHPSQILMLPAHQVRSSLQNVFHCRDAGSYFCLWSIENGFKRLCKTFWKVTAIGMFIFRMWRKFGCYMPDSSAQGKRSLLKKKYLSTSGHTSITITFSRTASNCMRHKHDQWDAFHVSSYYFICFLNAITLPEQKTFNKGVIGSNQYNISTLWNNIAKMKS